jgi:8-oxo-dGTP diphosphatase
VTLTALLGVYSDPKRDSRGHTVTVIYAAQATGMPQAADDAKSVGIFMLDDLPSPLAFDHAQVLEDFRRYRETGEVAPLRHL